MLLYVAANSRVVSAVVVVERKEEGKEYPVQRPVYYVSEVLTESKQRYPQWQKLVFGVFMASRKVKHYFQEHPITVVSAAPLVGDRAWTPSYHLRTSQRYQVTGIGGLCQ